MTTPPPPGIAFDTAPVPSTAPVGTSADSKSLTWSASWHGWDGLHLEVTRRTLLGQWIPGVTNLSNLGQPSDLDLSEPSLLSIPTWSVIPGVHLDQTRLSARVGARIAVDAAAFHTDGTLEGFDDGVELRRARIYARGDCIVVLPVSYEIEVGYIPNEFYIENSFVEFKNLGALGRLKCGQFQSPMSLVNVGSSRDMMFMEAAPAIQALAPGVEAGVQMGRPAFHQRMTWALGLFTDGVGDDFGDATEDFGRVIGRVTGLALDQVEPDDPRSATLLHLGLSGYVLYAGDETLRYRSRPASHLAPFVVDTGDFEADGASVIGVELAWVQGPLTFQGEALHAWGQAQDGRSVNFRGFYAAGSYFLTGESRPYDRARGTFARVIPTRNFQINGAGWGAWELAGRLSYVDLNNSEIHGGKLTMGAVALNWYLHSHFKWRFEFDFGHVASRYPFGNLQILQSRFELDF